MWNRLVLVWSHAARDLWSHVCACRHMQYIIHYTHSTCCSAVGRSVIHRSHLSPSINHPSIITIITTSVTTVGFIVAIMIITVPAVTRLVCALLWLSPALWHALSSLTAVWLHRSASVFLGPQVKTGPPTPLLPPRPHCTLGNGRMLVPRGRMETCGG